MPLTGLADTKTALFIPTLDTSNDAWITLMLPGIELALQTYIGYNIAQQSYTEYYNGNGGTEFLLKQLPVSSITNLWVDEAGYDGQNPAGSFTDPPLVAGTEYYLQLDGRDSLTSATGTVVRINGAVWVPNYYTPYNRLSVKQVPGNGNIKVQYVAGYSPIPADIQMAVWETVGALRQIRKIGFSGPITAEALTASSYSVGKLIELMKQLGSVSQVLSMYRRLPI